MSGQLNAGGQNFRGDDGSADAGVAAALAAYRAGEGSEHAALTALAAARLLVPVVAVLAEAGDDGAGDYGAGNYGAGNNSEMALPTLIGHDGRAAIIAFTSLDALSRWRPDARPVPAEADRVWRAAAADGCAVVIDVAGPVPLVIEGARLAALAARQPVPEPHEDPDVHAEVKAVIAGESAIAGARLAPGGSAGGDLSVQFLVAANASDWEPAVTRAAEQISARLANRLSRGIEITAAVAARVVGVARYQDQLQGLHAELGSSFIPVSADATDPVTAGQLIDAYRPAILVLNAGAIPLPRPLHHHTWRTFSQNWDVDVQHVFNWVREALLRPLDPGSTVLTVSSGAALRGSPLSGGYAGAKAAIRFITAYAADESERAGLGITFRCVLPQLTPATALGSVGIAAYAARQGVDVDSYLQAAGPALTIEQVGKAAVTLVTDSGHDLGAYLLTATGLIPAPA